MTYSAMITRPKAGESSLYSFGYINKATEDDLISSLKVSRDATIELFRTMSDDKGSYRYAADKWSLKELLGHISDAERVFAYRALRFSRRDATPLQAFEENDYVPASAAHQRTVPSLLREYEAVREATISLFEYMNDDMLDFQGSANQSTYSARSLGWMISGHNMHHIAVIRDRYL